MLGIMTSGNEFNFRSSPIEPEVDIFGTITYVHVDSYENMHIQDAHNLHFGISARLSIRENHIQNLLLEINLKSVQKLYSKV